MIAPEKLDKKLFGGNLVRGNYFCIWWLKDYSTTFFMAVIAARNSAPQISIE